MKKTIFLRIEKEASDSLGKNMVITLGVIMLIIVMGTFDVLFINSS
jgi:hypothetical protein